MMDLQRLRRLWIFLVLATVWTSVSAENDKLSEHDQPVKEFEMVQQKHCDSNTKNELQCTRLNENYMKFYLSVFLTIGWGGCVRTLIKTFELRIPYTVVLLMTGLIIGFGARINLKFCETWSMFTRFARTPPELILYIFLPILIFESAFSMKAHVFIRSFLSIVLVALPGMLLTTFVTAIASRQFMDNYGWTFSQASLFGAIISATDPVAVVAILREVGTSEMLSVMIEGESLLNDGVAILLYEIFKEIVEMPDSTDDPTLKIILQFFRIAVGGPVFGFVMGKITIYFLSLIFNDAATEITITLVSAYLTYFIGEFYLSVSGVMAVVLLGVTMSAESTCISPEVEHVVHQFWQMMSFIMNTVLFVLLGVVISETAINSFELRDGYNVIWLYFALNIIRLLMLIFLSPLLSKIGYGISWRNLTVMMWGGLRGAVGICLALEVYTNKKLCKFSNIGPKFLLQTAGIVILTLIINGTTTKSLLDYLGITTLSIGKLQDMANAVRTITFARLRTITALKHDRFLADANWEVVQKFTNLKDPYVKKNKANEERSKKVDKNYQRFQSAGTLLNEKVMISAANLQDNSEEKSLNFTESKPIVDIKKSQFHFVTHQGKVGTETGIGRNLDRLTSGINIQDDILSNSDNYKALLEESRLRVLKAMKISCWRQYERGSLSEQAVKLIVGDIEQKEDTLLSMVHVGDLRQHWEIKGFFPWLQIQIDGFVNETQPTPPKQSWRRPAFWLTTQSWFHGIIYFIIFLNLGPIILETYLLVKNKNPDDTDKWQRLILLCCTIIFTILYLIEFIIKIIGRGCGDYFNLREPFNLLDFIVLLISLVEMGVVLTALFKYKHFLEDREKQFGVIKAIRLVRFVRLLRWVRPLMPLLNSILEARINARLFMGYDVGKGYTSSIESALRFLPQIIEDKKILLKFKLILEEDRIQTVKELALLQLKHPGVVVAVKTRHASRSICNQMRTDLEDLRIDGLIDEKEFGLLTSKIEGNLKRLYAAPSSVKLEAQDIIKNISWVIGSPIILNYFKSNCQLLNLSAGDVLYEIGDIPNGIHMIISGLVKLQFEPTEEIVDNKSKKGIIPNTEFFLDLNFATSATDYLGSGAMIGELGVLTKSPRAASIICETDVEMYHWPQTVMDNGIKEFNDPYDSLESRLWRSFGIKLAAEYLPNESEYMSWTGDRIRTHLEQGVVPVGEKLNVLDVPEVISETILIYGELMNLHSSEVIQAPALVPQNWKKIGTVKKHLFIAKKEKLEIGPKLLMLAHEEGMEELLEKGSLPELHKCIAHGPSVDIDDEEEFDPVPIQIARQRKRSIHNLSLIKGQKVTGILA